MIFANRQQDRKPRVPFQQVRLPRAQQWLRGSSASTLAGCSGVETAHRPLSFMAGSVPHDVGRARGRCRPFARKGLSFGAAGATSRRDFGPAIPASSSNRRASLRCADGGTAPLAQQARRSPSKLLSTASSMPSFALAPTACSQTSSHASPPAFAYIILRVDAVFAEAQVGAGDGVRGPGSPDPTRNL